MNEQNDKQLTDDVAQFIREGVTAGDPVIVIVISGHRQSITRALNIDGFDVDGATRIGQLMFLDARHTLSAFMVDGMPDSSVFKKQIGGIIEKAHAARPGATVRAFSEMVELLWRDGNSQAAIRLEELWNELIHEYHYASLSASTARKTPESGLRELLTREQAARAKAETESRLKDEFIAVLSHELRTPLNAILGWIQILESRSDPQTIARALEVVRRNANLQLGLINDLLDVSRIMAGKMSLKTELMDLAQVIRASIDTVRPAALDKRIAMEVSVAEQGPVISGDADRLQQVFWNLLTNAIKFTPAGGKVRVNLETDDIELRVIFEDTGTGIDPEFLPYVFDRFRQAETLTTRKAGLGVGLAIVRYLVQAHGGRVAAESEGAGLGARFVVTLPMLQSSD